MTTVWMLVLTISGESDQAEVRAGLLATEPLCEMAGAGIAAALTERVAGVVVTWTCAAQPLGVAV